MINLSLFVPVLLATSLSTSAISDEFTGWRVGGGYSKASLEVSIGNLSLFKEDFDKGYRVETGYDFNSYVGVALSYDRTNEERYGQSLGTRAIEISTDIGYVFEVQSTFIKPYVKLGYVNFQDDSSPYYNDESFVTGLGLRMQYSHFYTDLNLDFYSLSTDLYYYDSKLDWEVMQTSLTLGYKF